MTSIDMLGVWLVAGHLAGVLPSMTFQPKCNRR